MLKRYFAAVLCCMLLNGCVEEVTEPNPAVRKDVSDETLYSGILKSLSDCTNVSEYKGKVEQGDVEKAVNNIRRDHPEIFWIDGYTVTSSEKKSKIEIDVLNDLKTDKLLEMCDKFSKAADKALSELPKDLDDYGKAVAVHDYLVKHADYDTAGAESSKNGLWGTAYGCLVDGRAVCQGYADAFSYMMKKLGIECGVVSGMAWSFDPYSGGTNEPQSHAWNYVKLHGKYYWMDVTWDDPVNGNVAGEPITHTYCLIDDERLKRTRTIDEGQKFVPSCYSMDDNYYVRHGAYVTVYSRESIGNAMRKSESSTETEIMFADKNAYEKSMEMLFKNGAIWEYSDYAEIGSSVDFTQDDVMYTLKISYK